VDAANVSAQASQANSPATPNSGISQHKLFSCGTLVERMLARKEASFRISVNKEKCHIQKELDG